MESLSNMTQEDAFPKLEGKVKEREKKKLLVEEF